QGAAMSQFGRLAGLFRRTEGTPPPMHASFAAENLHSPDHPETEIAPPPLPREHWLKPLDDDLSGVSFGIEYRDAAGTATRRRVTIRQIGLTPSGNVCIVCFCHERRALRTFRFDRITDVIDGDGVVWNPRRFFAEELHVDFGHLSTSPAEIKPGARPEMVKEVAVKRTSARRARSSATVGAGKPGYAQRRIARDGLRVLVAMARADRHLADEEIEVVLDYVVHRAERAGIPSGDADCRAIAAYLRRLTPHADVLGECLERLGREDVSERRHLLDSAIAVMNADGTQDPAEVDLVLRIRESLEISTDGI
ncbi:MAG TPA: WYL domain-containing protein, partial [Acetobacteraceae bacterium]|nr:WYL domain-containing protein [Acetobacteraceae bacterium]